MEDHKSEIDKWDFGAGIYISFYLLRSSLLEDNNCTSELVSELMKYSKAKLLNRVYKTS